MAFSLSNGLGDLGTGKYVCAGIKQVNCVFAEENPAMAGPYCARKHGSNTACYRACILAYTECVIEANNVVENPDLG